MSSIEAPVPSDLLRLGRADRDEVILVLDAQRVNGEEWRVLMRKAKQAAGTIMPIELDILIVFDPIVLRVVGFCWSLDLLFVTRYAVVLSVEFLVNENHGHHGLRSRTVTDSVFTSVLLASRTVTDCHGLSRTSVTVRDLGKA